MTIRTNLTKMRQKKTIEEKYTSMTEREHILFRSGMYVGSVNEETKQKFIYDKESEKMTISDIVYSEAMLKLFDEVLSNSCDEFRRKDNMGLTEIQVSINTKDNKITIRDNGGIPIKKHKDAQMYVPEFIFGQLRTSSNYDDSDNRTGVGTNGLGAVLTNIFSTSFKVKTADSKHQLEVEWTNNMQNKLDSKIIKSNEHFTETSFILDFERFKQNTFGLTEDFISIMHKRCIDAAAANIGLKITFKINDTDKYIWKFNKFSQYIDLYSDIIDTSAKMSFDHPNGAKIWIYPGSNINVGFINGAECSKGTHMNFIRLSINKAIQDVMAKKKMTVTLHNVDSKYSVFCILDVVNPSYDSQTKECLTTPVDKFYRDGEKFNIPDEFLKKISKSELLDIMVDWYSQKQSADEQAKIRRLNRESGKLLRDDKFINCTSKKAEERQLWIFEGDSAASGFRQGRNSETQAGYLMRGVPQNCLGAKASEIMKNKVLNDIIKILGLKFGEYNKREDLKYQKIVIASDRDFDGHKIAALLIVFFNNFPELFEQQVVCRIISPIIIATKGKDVKKFYNIEDFRKQESKFKNWTIKYVKGLGGQSIKEYSEMMQSNFVEYYTKDQMSEMMLTKWFGKGIASERKDMLKADVEA